MPLPVHYEGTLQYTDQYVGMSPRTAIQVAAAHTGAVRGVSSEDGHERSMSVAVDRDGRGVRINRPPVREGQERWEKKIPPDDDGRLRMRRITSLGCDGRRRGGGGSPEMATTTPQHLGACRGPAAALLSRALAPTRLITARITLAVALP